MRKHNILDVKKYIKDEFIAHNIDCYEINYLLAGVMNRTITELILIDTISNKEFLKIKKIVSKRVKGEPLTKIFKKAYFYNNEFYINKNVLSCRPETELLVEMVDKMVLDKQSKILDLCCGSGCIGLTLKTLGFENVTLADISKNAIKVAKKNAKSLGQDVIIKQSDLFKKIDEKFDVIVSNPPYIKTNDIKSLDKEVKNYDPIISLDGGEDGLLFYRTIISQLDNHLTENGKIFFEIGYDQAEDVCNMFSENYTVKVIKDYSSKDRVVMATRR